MTRNSDPPDFLDVAKLPVLTGLPDPLQMFDGRRVINREMWLRDRKPELKALFQHYMYGSLPDPVSVTCTSRRIVPDALDGKATLKEISIHYGPDGCPPLELLLVTPNRVNKPVPIFLGLNFHGNHTVLDEPLIRIPTGWMRPSALAINNRATEAGRGKQAESWSIEESVDRGFAVATFYYGDGLPDKPDYADGSYPYFVSVKGEHLGPSDCGAIAYWAWTLQRAVDYLVTNSDIDRQKIAVMGHSRHGKAALVAAAFDERIALVVSHQAGCGGTAPSRTHNEKAETVKIINDSFPHWFCGNFKRFNDDVGRLPFDQHCLMALCAPRPVLCCAGTDDQWADPAGQLEMLKAANPVYELMAADGIAARETAPVGELVGGVLGYYLRTGVHVTDRSYWSTFLDFASTRLKQK
jgi:hypothetical protein